MRYAYFGTTSGSNLLGHLHGSTLLHNRSIDGSGSGVKEKTDIFWDFSVRAINSNYLL